MPCIADVVGWASHRLVFCTLLPELQVHGMASSQCSLHIPLPSRQASYTTAAAPTRERAATVWFKKERTADPFLGLGKQLAARLDAGSLSLTLRQSKLAAAQNSSHNQGIPFRGGPRRKGGGSCATHRRVISAAGEGLRNPPTGHPRLFSASNQHRVPDAIPS